MVAAEKLRNSSISVRIDRHPYLRLVDADSTGFGEFAQHGLILHILRREHPEPEMPKVTKKVYQRAQERLEYTKILKATSTAGEKQQKALFTPEYRATLQYRDRALLNQLGSDFTRPKDLQLTDDQRAEYQNTLIETVRSYPAFSRLEGTKFLMTRKNVGLHMAEKILEDIRLGVWDWGMDLSKQRRYRFAEKQLLAKIPDKKKWPPEYFAHCEAESNNLGGVQGFGNWVGTEVDRELYLDIVQYFYPQSLALLIGDGVTVNDIVHLPKYQKIRNLAEEFMPAMGNPYA